jgi:hypothetical protein
MSAFFFQNQILLNGENFHRISKLTSPEKKIYSILIQNQTYHLSPEETLLLSNSAFQSNSFHGKPFVINVPSNKRSETFFIQLKSSMNSLLSLFQDQVQIEISFQDKESFDFLGRELENRSLLQVCNFVTPTQSQMFFLNSERFRDISDSLLRQLHNFTLIINQQRFPCNSIFAACLSRNIFEAFLINSNINEFEWNDPQHDQILVSLFYLLLGFPFPSFRFDSHLLFQAFVLIGFHPDEIKIGNPNTFEEAILFLSNLTCSIRILFQLSCKRIFFNAIQKIFKIIDKVN